MPTWLVHAFRWPRPLIRIHIILENLEDAAAEWLMAPATHDALFDNFKNKYPEIMQTLSHLKFIEQYDPKDLKTCEQPYAYVCDQVHEVTLGTDIDDVRGQGVANEAWAALADLRDKIAPDQKIGWFIVVNGDVERAWPGAGSASLGNDSAEGTHVSSASKASKAGTEATQNSNDTKSEKGFKKWVNKMTRAKSFKDLRGTSKGDTSKSPPVPDTKHKRSRSDSKKGNEKATAVGTTTENSTAGKSQKNRSSGVSGADVAHTPADEQKAPTTTTPRFETSPPRDTSTPQTMVKLQEILTPPKTPIDEKTIEVEQAQEERQREA